MINGCPGALGIKGAPTLKLKTCPSCGAELELFSSEISTECRNCGFVAYNDTQTCLNWCKYAGDCVGEELYKQFLAAKQDKDSILNKVTGKNANLS
jgi:predicted RNA-binding Zn-ribbon protein involved in translation (DUF1610 family)